MREIKRSLSTLGRRMVAIGGASAVAFKPKKLRAEELPPTPSELEWDAYYQRQLEFHAQVEPDFENALKNMINENPDGQPLTLLDLAAGAGPVALRAAQGAGLPGWEKGCAFQVTAVDKNRNALKVTEQRAEKAGVARCIQTSHQDISAKLKLSKTSKFNFVAARAAVPFLHNDQSNSHQDPLQKIVDTAANHLVKDKNNKSVFIFEVFGIEHPWCSKWKCHTAQEALDAARSRFNHITITTSHEPATLSDGSKGEWHEHRLTCRDPTPDKPEQHDAPEMRN